MSKSIWILCFEWQLLCILQLDILCRLSLCVVGDAQTDVTHKGNITPFLQIFHPERFCIFYSSFLGVITVLVISE